MRRWLVLILGSLCVLLLSLLWMVYHQQPGISLVPFLNGNQNRIEKQLSSLSDSARLNQLILYQPVYSNKGTITSADGFSGVLLENLPLKPSLLWTDSIQRVSTLPLFCATDQTVLHNPAFSDTYPFPPAAVWKNNLTTSLKRQLHDLYVQQSAALGLNLVVPFDLNAPLRDSTDQIELLRELQDRNILAGAKGLPPYNPVLADTSEQFTALFQALKVLTVQGLSVVWIDSKLPGTEDYMEKETDFYRNYLKKGTGFEGLMVGVLNEKTSLSYLSKLGVDLYVTQEQPAKMRRSLQELLNSGTLDKRTLRKNLRRILLAKNWMYGSHHPPKRSAQYSPLQVDVPESSRSLERMLNHFQGNDWGSIAYNLRSRSLRIIQNPHKLLPLPINTRRPYVLWKTGRPYYPALDYFFQKYSPFQSVAALPPDTAAYSTAIVVLDDLSPSIQQGSVLHKQLVDLNRKKPLVVVQFGQDTLPKHLDSTFTLVQIPESHPHTQGLLAELLFGALDTDSRSQATPDSSSWATRIQFTPAAFDRQQGGRFEEVDQVIQNAIKHHYMPGCQVLVLKEGEVTYHKSVGNHQYETAHPVQTTDLYDIASLTKIATTTLLVMRSVDSGKLRIQDPIGTHIPWLRGTRVGALPVWKLLSHQSGLPAAIPVYSYIRARTYSKRACDAYFCIRRTGNYQLEVADNLYFNQRYLAEIKRNVAALRPKKSGGYAYSDLNFWLLQQVLESIHRKDLATLAREELYEPLGLRHTMYLPKGKIPLDQIVPTAYDKTWRRQWLQGWVHDPTAAVIGGVSGHAGLFSNTEDLAVLMQLLLQEGKYGSSRMLSAEVIQQFTETRVGSRALGFDRPSSENKFLVVSRAGRKTFGHTGFTGGCIWLDPKEQLVYIFLSNRIYPDGKQRGLVDNQVREKVMQAIYRGLAKENQTGLPVY